MAWPMPTATYRERACAATPTFGREPGAEVDRYRQQAWLASGQAFANPPGQDLEIHRLRHERRPSLARFSNGLVVGIGTDDHRQEGRSFLPDPRDEPGAADARQPVVGD